MLILCKGHEEPSSQSPDFKQNEEVLGIEKTWSFGEDSHLRSFLPPEFGRCFGQEVLSLFCLSHHEKARLIGLLSIDFQKDMLDVVFWVSLVPLMRDTLSRCPMWLLIHLRQLAQRVRCLRRATTAKSAAASEGCCDERLGEGRKCSWLTPYMLGRSFSSAQSYVL